MNYRNFILSVLFIITFLIGCKESVVNPEDTLPPGRRNYKWTADTINVYMLSFNRIGGTSPSSVWSAANSGDGESIWHYSGDKWEPAGNYFNTSYWAVCALEENNIWIAGLEGNIWHYNGNWQKNAKIMEEGIDNYAFLDFCSNNRNDLYLAGSVLHNDKRVRGVIMHYNGYSWKKEYHSSVNSQYMRMTKDENYPGKYFLCSIEWSNNKPGQTDTMSFLKYDGIKGEKIHSSLILNYSPAILSKIGRRVYFGMNDGLYRYEQDKLVPFLKLPANTVDRYMSFGRHEKDLFIATREGIMHYNGTNTEYVLKFPRNLVYLDAVVFDNDIFILTTPNYMTSIIYHGKLN